MTRNEKIQQLQAELQNIRVEMSVGNINQIIKALEDLKDEDKKK